jgi:hypothetical protein
MRCPRASVPCGPNLSKRSLSTLSSTCRGPTRAPRARSRRAQPDSRRQLASLRHRSILNHSMPPHGPRLPRTRRHRLLRSTRCRSLLRNARRHRLLRLLRTPPPRRNALSHSISLHRGQRTAGGRTSTPRKKLHSSPSHHRAARTCRSAPPAGRPKSTPRPQPRKRRQALANRKRPGSARTARPGCSGHRLRKAAFFSAKSCLVQRVPSR